MTLRDSISDDAAGVFLNNDEFSETVTYYPHRYFGDALRSPRSIKAVVIREEVTTLTENGEVTSPLFQVHVANDDTIGISSVELDTGGDQISFGIRDGEASTRRTIVRLLTQDSGMLVLECR